MDWLWRLGLLSGTVKPVLFITTKVFTVIVDIRVVIVFLNIFYLKIY
jgi:hypothetical protein